MIAKSVLRFSRHQAEAWFFTLGWRVVRSWFRQAFSFSGIRHVLSFQPGIFCWITFAVHPSQVKPGLSEFYPRRFQAMAAVAVICGRNNGLTLGVPSLLRLGVPSLLVPSTLVLFWSQFVGHKAWLEGWVRLWPVTTSCNLSWFGGSFFRDFFSTLKGTLGGDIRDNKREGFCVFICSIFLTYRDQRLLPFWPAIWHPCQSANLSLPVVSLEFTGTSTNSLQMMPSLLCCENAFRRPQRRYCALWPLRATNFFWSFGFETRVVLFHGMWVPMSHICH